jgi:hypothetical protein
MALNKYFELCYGFNIFKKFCWQPKSPYAYCFI